MDKYESTVKVISAPIEAVYAKLSDLSRLEAVKERIDDPNFEQLLRTQVPADKMPSAEQLEKLREGVRSMQLTPDSVTGQAGPLGTVTLQIVERQEPKLIKFELQGAPIQGNVWIQLLPSNLGTAMKVTIGAELNFFIRKMVESKLKQGAEGLAQMLAAIPY